MTGPEGARPPAAEGLGAPVRRRAGSRYTVVNMLELLYERDLAYIHAAAFSGLAEGAAPEIVRRLRSARAAIRSVVDVGCGAGPLATALVEAGFDVTGIDASADLITIAQQRVPKARFLHSSIYDAEIPACQAIVAVGEPLAYHAESADADSRIASLFHRAAQALPAGGMFIFDLIEFGEPSLGSRSWHSGEDWAVLVETSEKQDSRTLVRRIETFRRVGELYRRGCEVHTVRLFDTAALLNQLAGCGFETETAQAYGASQLPLRRRAFFCARV